MVDFRPLFALRPAPGMAADVAAVPYDVVNTAEARVLAEGKPFSLLRITRPEIELAEDIDVHADEVYAKAGENLALFLEKGALQMASQAGFYAYAQTMNGRRQLGLMGLASAKDYWADRIKKHELTRVAKENDRLRHIETLRAHMGPVFLTYRSQADLNARLAALTAGAPEVDFVAHDGVRHQIWPILDEAECAAIRATFAAIDTLYIADGHHRAAAASRVGKDAPENDPRGHFLAVAFPHDELRILPYHRVVHDLNGLTAEGFLTALAAHFEVQAVAEPFQPEVRHEFGMCLQGAWYRLALKAASIPNTTDPVATLDVSLLQSLVLGPVLAIDDPRKSERIDFVGGIRGLPELARRVAEGSAVAFSLYPTTLDELMTISDAGQIMPPKSTWFEPKLRSGLVISRF